MKTGYDAGRDVERATTHVADGLNASSNTSRRAALILGVIRASIAIPVLGITISLVGASANTQQEVSVQENAQDDVSVQ